MVTFWYLLLPYAAAEAFASQSEFGIQPLSNLDAALEQPSLTVLRLPDVATSASNLPSSAPVLSLYNSSPALQAKDADPNQFPTPLTVIDPAVIVSWSDLPSESSPESAPTELEPTWIEFLDVLEPHMWWPAPTFLMPAPMLGFPTLDEERTGEDEELVDTLPTAIPESILGPIDPEVVGSGSVVDRSFDWAFFDSGDVTVDGEVLSPTDGQLTRWLPGDTTYAGLFNDGLLVGSHLIPYPEEYQQWMQEHNVVIWK